MAAFHQCSKCLETKPAIKFPKHGEGRWHRCRACGTETWEANRRAEGLDPQYVRTKLRNTGNYEEILSNSKKRKSHYDQQLKSNEGRCQICNQHEKKRARRGKYSLDGPTQKLSRDHCHATKQWRGVLCSGCNPGIGCFKEDLAILKKAACYLRERPTFEALIYDKHSRIPKEITSCEICDCVSPFPGRYNSLHLDHCHRTGKVRGYLCYHCNQGVGFFRDSPENIDSAIDYLRMWGRTEYSPPAVSSRGDYSWRNTPYVRN